MWSIFYIIELHFFEQAEKLHAEDVDGIKTKMRQEMNDLEDKLTSLQSQLKGQQDIIENKLKTVSKSFPPQNYLLVASPPYN